MVPLALHRCTRYSVHCRFFTHADNATVFSGVRRHSVPGDSVEPSRNLTLYARTVNSGYKIPLHHDTKLHMRWTPMREGHAGKLSLKMRLWLYRLCSTLSVRWTLMHKEHTAFKTRLSLNRLCSALSIRRILVHKEEASLKTKLQQDN